MADEEKTLHEESFSVTGVFNVWIFLVVILFLFSFIYLVGNDAGGSNFETAMTSTTFTFILLLILICVKSGVGNQEAIITNKRICLSYRFAFWFTNSLETPLEDVEGVSINGKSIIVRTTGGQSCRVIYAELPETFKRIADEEIARAKGEASKNAPQPTPAPVQVVEKTSSSADEILKYKNLLDMGAITQEEFDAKKKELLG